MTYQIVEPQTQYYRIKEWVVFSELWIGTNKYVVWAVHQRDFNRVRVLSPSGAWDLPSPHEFISPDETECSIAGIDTTSRDAMCRYIEDRIMNRPPAKKKKTRKAVPAHARTMEDKQWAILVKHRDGKCQECGSIKNLHAHHVKSYRHHPELRHDLNNGITLCGHCHRKHHAINGR